MLSGKPSRVLADRGGGRGRRWNAGLIRKAILEKANMYSLENGKASRVVSGRGLRHRRLDARQRAAIAADILAGEIALRPSIRQLAALFDVSEVYIRLARELSSGKRRAIANGLDQTSFALLLKPPVEQPALPAPKLVSDEQLAAAIRAVGIDHTLEIAASVEACAA
jgi:hypothetical protein